MMEVWVIVVTEMVVVDRWIREVGGLGAGVWVEDLGRPHLPPFPFDEDGGGGGMRGGGAWEGVWVGDHLGSPGVVDSIFSSKLV